MPTEHQLKAILTTFNQQYRNNTFTLEELKEHTTIFESEEDAFASLMDTTNKEEAYTSLVEILKTPLADISIKKYRSLAHKLLDEHDHYYFIKGYWIFNSEY